MTAAYFEDHPTDPDKVILRKPKYEDDDIQDYKKPWVGLTDDELMKCTVFKHFDYDPPYINKDGKKFVASHEVSLRATYEKIEQALKEKNT